MPAIIKRVIAVGILFQFIDHLIVPLQGTSFLGSSSLQLASFNAEAFAPPTESARQPITHHSPFKFMELLLHAVKMNSVKLSHSDQYAKAEFIRLSAQDQEVLLLAAKNAGILTIPILTRSGPWGFF